MKQMVNQGLDVLVSICSFEFGSNICKIMRVVQGHTILLNNVRSSVGLHVSELVAGLAHSRY